MDNGKRPAEMVEEIAQQVPPETDELAGDVVSNDDLGDQGNERAESEAD